MFKRFLMLMVVAGMLAGCASTGETDQDTDQDEEVTQTDEDSMEDESDVDVATTFYFDFDQSTLKPAARAALAVHAERLQEEPTNIRLEGHADERGSREYNMALGERRANAVRDFLVLQGVDSNLIETVSYGEERPAVMGSYEGAWEQNRRVELK